MDRVDQNIKGFVEPRAFGVFNTLGSWLGIQSSKTRLFFIYVSFIAISSPLIIYLVLLFWLNMGKYIKTKRGKIWDY